MTQRISSRGAWHRQADTYAKQGAAKHAFSEEEILDFKQHRSQNIMIVRAVVKLWSFVLGQGTWVDSDDALLECPFILQADPDPAAPLQRGGLTVVEHALCERPWGLQCNACRRWARTDAQREKLAALPCKPLRPHLVRHDDAGRVHVSHDIKHHAASGVIWCDRCGAYADRVLKGLSDLCFPYLGRAGRAARTALRDGKHPRTRDELVEAPAPGHRAARPPPAPVRSGAARDDRVILDPAYLLAVDPDGTLLLDEDEDYMFPLDPDGRILVGE